MLGEPLPIRLSPMEGESALGFCLRSVRANGLNLHWLRREVGVGECRIITAAYADRISMLLQCDPEWLRAGLSAGSRAEHIIYLGHHLHQRNQLRGTHPQICVRCAHREGVCRATWELSLVTACPVHNCLLIDTCSVCGATLSWDRPELAICRCGRPFRTGNASSPGAFERASAVLLSDLLEKKLYARAHPPSDWTNAGLPSFLHSVSLGAAASVIKAFGWSDQPYQRLAASSSTRAISTDVWLRVVERACERLSELQSMEVSAWHQLAPDVCQSTLAGLIKHASEPGDYAAGVRLMTGIFGLRETRHMRRDVRQLDLF